MLIAAGNKAAGVGNLDSKRVYRYFGPNRAQMEIGRQADTDPLAHLAWSNALDVQRILATSVGRTGNVVGQASPEHDYTVRLVLEQKGTDGITRYLEIGQLSESFHYDLRKLWSQVDKVGKLRPAPTIHHLYLVAVTTVGLSEEQRGAVPPPFNISGLALAPVVKGFPMIQFLHRYGRRNR
jgi:hypothetical protein